MSKTVYTYAPEPVAEPPKPEKSPAVSYHIKAGILIGLSVFAVVVITGLVFELDLRLTLKAGAWLGVLAAVAVGVPWTYIATTHDWRMDTAERKRRWEAEDYARYNAYNQDNTAPPSAPIHGERLDRLARLILERHYLDGLDATREAREAPSIYSPRD